MSTRPEALTVEALAAKYNLSPDLMAVRLREIGVEPTLHSPPRYDAEDVDVGLARWDEQRSEQTIRRVFTGSSRPLAEKVLREALDAARPKLRGDLKGDGIDLRIKRLRGFLSGTVAHEAPHRVRALLQAYDAAHTMDGQADVSEELAIAFDDYAATLTKLLDDLYSQAEPLADAALGAASNVPAVGPESVEPQPQPQGTRRKAVR
jgi:hypothetical protein